jgi:oligosaccharide repeat unit polymerase
MEAVFLLAAVVTVLTVLRFGGGLTSPAVLYAGVWSVALTLASLPSRGYLPMADTTWRLALAAFAAFLLGCLIAAAIRHRILASRPSFDLGPYEDQLLDRAYSWALGALVCWIALELYRALPVIESAGGLSAIFGGSGLSFREASLQASAQAATTDFQSGSLITALLGYVLFLGNLALIWAGYYAVRGRWIRAFAPLFLLACYSLLTLQRFEFVYSLLIFLFSYVFHRRLVADRARTSPGRMLILGAVFLMVVFVPLQFRGQATTQSQRLDSVIDYVAGGVAGLNTMFAEHLPAPSPAPGHGAWSLYGAATIAKRLGAPFDLPPTYLPYESISNTRVVNNNVETYLIYPYFDFGLPGAIAAALLLGFGATVLERAVRLGQRLGLIAAASVGLTTIVMSFFGLTLVRDLRWTYLVIVAYVVTPKLLRRGEPLKPGQEVVSGGFSVRPAGVAPYGAA